MVDLKQRAGTIKYAVPNLRYRWPKELEPFSDNQVAACYEDFGQSEDFGNNDEKFPLWFDMLEEYPKETVEDQRRNFLDGR